MYLLLVSPQNRKYNIDATFPEINTRIYSFSFFHCSHLADGYPTRQVNKLVNVNKSPVIKTDKDYRIADNIPMTSVHQELTHSASTRGLAGCTSSKISINYHDRYQEKQKKSSNICPIKLILVKDLVD